MLRERPSEEYDESRERDLEKVSPLPGKRTTMLPASTTKEQVKEYKK